MTRLVLLCAFLGSACARMQTPPPVTVTDSPKGRSRGGGAGMIVGAVLGGSAVAGGIAYAGVTLAARRSKSRPQPEAESAAPAADTSSTAGASAPAPPPSKQSAGGVGVQSKLAGVDDDMTFSLSPERLTVISELNSRLEPLADHLATVPIFTVTLGGKTSPLTVPGPDGQKLAYFFFEAADAAAFLRAVVDQTGMKMEAGVVGLRLSEVVRAYGSETAAAAKETFVLIPMMSEVAMARKLVKQRELALEASGQPVPERDDDKLDATNGLVRRRRRRTRWRTRTRTNRQAHAHARGLRRGRGPARGISPANRGTHSGDDAFRKALLRADHTAREHNEGAI